VILEDIQKNEVLLTLKTRLATARRELNNSDALRAEQRANWMRLLKEESFLETELSRLEQELEETVAKRYRPAS
jgi:hypothetical protein